MVDAMDAGGPRPGMVPPTGEDPFKNKMPFLAHVSDASGNMRPMTDDERARLLQQRQQQSETPLPSPSAEAPPTGDPFVQQVDAQLKAATQKGGALYYDAADPSFQPANPEYKNTSLYKDAAARAEQVLKGQNQVPDATASAQDQDAYQQLLGAEIQKQLPIEIARREKAAEVVAKGVTAGNVDVAVGVLGNKDLMQQLQQNMKAEVDGKLVTPEEWIKKMMDQALVTAMAQGTPFNADNARAIAQKAFIDQHGSKLKYQEQQAASASPLPQKEEPVVLEKEYTEKDLQEAQQQILAACKDIIQDGIVPVDESGLAMIVAIKADLTHLAAPEVLAIGAHSAIEFQRLRLQRMESVAGSAKPEELALIEKLKLEITALQSRYDQLHGHETAVQALAGHMHHSFPLGVSTEKVMDFISGKDADPQFQAMMTQRLLAQAPKYTQKYINGLTEGRVNLKKPKDIADALGIKQLDKEKLQRLRAVLPEEIKDENGAKVILPLLGLFMLMQTLEKTDKEAAGFDQRPG